jgi:translation initiation factor RLI1
VAGKIALVDYRFCDPDRCKKGVCAAVEACERRLLRQEAPAEVPMADPSLCRGCGDCVVACPLAAIRLAAG